MILLGYFDDDTESYKATKKATQADFIAFARGMKFRDNSVALNRSEAAALYNALKQLPCHVLCSGYGVPYSSKYVRANEICREVEKNAIGVLVVEFMYHISDTIRVPFIQYSNGTAEEMETARKAILPYLRAAKIKRI